MLPHPQGSVVVFSSWPSWTDWDPSSEQFCRRTPTTFALIVTVARWVRQWLRLSETDTWLHHGYTLLQQLLVMVLLLPCYLRATSGSWPSHLPCTCSIARVAGGGDQEKGLRVEKIQ